QMRPQPILRQPALFGVRIAETQIPIPNGVSLGSSASVFVVENAEAISIHILRCLRNQMIINKGIGVDVGAIPLRRITKVRPIENSLKFIEMTFQPGFLDRSNFIRPGLDEVKLIRARCLEAVLLLERVNFIAHGLVWAG